MFSLCPMPVERHFGHRVAELDKVYRNPILHLRSGKACLCFFAQLSHDPPRGVGGERDFSAGTVDFESYLFAEVGAVLRFFFYKLEALVDGFLLTLSQKQRLAGSNSTCFLVTTVP